LNDNFIKACYGQAVSQIPVWFMRQAGRYQPEYRAIRQKNTLMEIVYNPELCAEVTLLPVSQLGVDAAILFSEPIRTLAQIQALTQKDFAAATPYVGDAIKLIREKLEVPLIGFCGAPYTLAYYLVEGGKSKSWNYLHGMMYSNDERWPKLMKHIADVMTVYLKYQADNGAQALQLFDSWAGDLSYDDYEKYVFPYVYEIFEGLSSLEVPKIYFGLKTSHLFPLLKQYKCEVIGVDHTIEITNAKEGLGEDKALQGNLAPTALFADKAILTQKVNHILKQYQAYDNKGFIFNLGHGCLPEMKSEDLKYVVELVHNWKV